jgi:subtilisin family serine protease
MRDDDTSGRTYEGTRPRSPKIRVTLRLKVPVGGTREDAVIGALKTWDAELQRHVEQDRSYPPIPVRPPRSDRHREEYLTGRSELVTIRVLVEPKYLPALRAAPHVDQVDRDARVQPFGPRPAALMSAAGRVDCGGSDSAAGTVADVAAELGVTRLRASAGLTGRGIVVGVVDGGITAHGRPTKVGAWPSIPQVPALGDVIGGWPPADWGTTAEGWGQHGNMIAFDVQAMAPEAELWDIRIWQPDVSFEAYASNAIQGYRLAIDYFQAHGVPQILVNSWGVYDSADGPEYAFDPKSSMAAHVEEAIDAGMLVLFAAGNCGDGCPIAAGTLCGIGNRGPGASILGPNGHPDVMTVGAATLQGEWCGYTSQGPAALPPNDPDKPDFCGISQFAGFFPNDSGLRPYDGGTSAANAIAAGIVALLKQARPELTQLECKQLLAATARPIRVPAAREGAGAGVIDALRAFRSL